MFEHHKKFLIISAIFLCISVIILFLLTFVPNPTSSKIPVSTPVPVNAGSQSNPIPPVPASTDPIITQRQFSMDPLYSFLLTYPSNWSLVSKRLHDANTANFKSIIKGNCEDNCAGIRLSKEDFSFDIVIAIAPLGPSKGCTNTAELTSLNRDWFRIKDSTGYWYTRNINEGPVVTSALENSDSEHGSYTDEWSYVGGEKRYNFCVDYDFSGLLGDGPIPRNDENGKPLVYNIEKILLPSNTPIETVKEVDAIIEQTKVYSNQM